MILVVETLDLISVIVPVYNVEKYLRQCLDSILRQTYSNIEVIMIDDGSPDSCGAICDEYADKYDNFKAVHKENAGLGMARNTGLEYAAGKYVMFLDSDDYIDADLIGTLYSSIISSAVDFCKSGYRKIKNDVEIVQSIKYENEIFIGSAAAKRFLPMLIGSSPQKNDSIGMSVWASLYNIKPIRENNILFPSEKELAAEDLIFNIKYMQYANGAAVISKVGYNYRINPLSLTKSYRSNKFDGTIKLYNYVRELLFKFGYGIDTIYRLERTVFVWTLGCIRQENMFVSTHKLDVAINNIKKICANDTLQNMLKEYPITKLRIKQQVFLRMVEHKMALTLYFCTRFMPM